MGIIRFLVGALMTVSTLGQVTVIGLHDDRLGPAAIDWANPSLATTTNATEADLGLDAQAAATNINDASGVPYADLKVSGSPTSRVSMTVNTALPGVPEENARFTYTDGTDIWGANEPYVFSSIETISGFTSGSGAQRPSMTATPDGVVHCVYEAKSSAPGGVHYRAWDWSTESWGASKTIYTATQAIGAGGYNAAPAIWWIRSNTASGYVLFVALWDADGTNVTLKIYASTDAGATWTGVKSNLVLPYGGAQTYDYTQIEWDGKATKNLTLQFVENNGGVLTSRHYVSHDLTGGRWSHVSQGDISNVETQSMTSFCGLTYLAVTTTGSALVKIYRREGSQVGWTQISSDTGASADVDYLGLVANDSGWLYLMYRAAADEDEIMLQVSTNQGDDWGDPSGEYPWDDGNELLILDDDADGATTTLVDGLKFYGIAWTTETMFVAGNLATSGTTVDNSLMCARFGGMSDITLAEAASAVEAPYYPCSVPATKSSQYTYVGGSVESIMLDSENQLVYNIDNSISGGSVNYILVGDPAVTGVDCTFGPDSDGGSLATNAWMVGTITHNNATTLNYNVRIRVSWTDAQLQAYDIVAGATIGSIVAFDNTKGLTIRGATNGETGKTSWYFRQTGDTTWTPIIENQSPSSVGYSLTSRIYFGKETVMGASGDFRSVIPYGSSSSGYIADLADGFTSADLIPIRATTFPQRNIHGFHFWWEGSPLPIGGQWSVTSHSDSGVAYTSPLCATPSPTKQWVGSAGTGGATYRCTFAMPSGYRSRLSNNMVHLSWFNAPQIASASLKYYNGATLQTIATGSAYWRPFGSDGSVAFARDSASSYMFRPNGANGTPQALYPQDCEGWWCRISDGVNTVASYIERLHQGQFSNAAGVRQMAIELDPEELIVEAGSFAALSNSTAVGSIILCRPDGMIVGADDVDSQGYYAWEVTLAPGVTVPKAGLVMAGPAYLLSVPERDGGSIRLIGPDEIRIIEPSGFAQGERVRRRTKRIVEAAFEEMILQDGRVKGGTVVNAASFNGSTPRALVDNNLDVIEMVRERSGQRIPISMAINVEFSADPGVSDQVFGGKDVLLGYLEKTSDRVASRGPVRSKGGRFEESGRLLVEELL